jgi:hypothetical protein
MDGDFIDPAAFRLREEHGKLENGLSTNWSEFFHAQPVKAVKPLREMLEQKGRRISANRGSIPRAAAVLPCVTCSVPYCPFDQPIDSQRRREFSSGRIPVSIRAGA